MQIIDYFMDARQAHWQSELARCEWRAAQFLLQLLREGAFHRTLGTGTLYLLAEGDRLVSFLTLAHRDCVDADSLWPWIGFVHTAPEFRGHRYVGRLIEHAMRKAGMHGAQQVYICTDHVGLYEKYGFEYLTNRVSIYGEDSRVYVRRTIAPTVQIVPITAENFCPESLDAFIRHQEVRECWRMTSCGWELQPAVFTEHWDAARLRREAEELLMLSAEGTPVFAAFADEVAVGFAALGERLGSEGQYMELRSLHVSAPWRGRGLGRRLFQEACRAAGGAGAKKLYISAHSSKESQAAYRALGCVNALEPDPARVAAEPCDVQMEFELTAPYQEVRS